MEKSKLHKLLGIELDEDYNIYDILQLSRIDGLSKTQAAKLAVLRDVISEYNTTVPVDNRFKIKSPNEAAAMMYGIMKGLDHEECWCMFLNSANKVIRRLRNAACLINKAHCVSYTLTAYRCAYLKAHNWKVD